MNEQIGGAIIAREIGRVGAISNPGDIFVSRLQFAQSFALRTVADDEQMEILRPPSLQEFEALE